MPTDCLERELAAYSGPRDVFGWLTIGLDPELQVVEQGADYRPSAAAGMVYIAVGANEMLGGQNRTQGGNNFPRGRHRGGRRQGARSRWAPGGWHDGRPSIAASGGPVLRPALALAVIASLWVAGWLLLSLAVLQWWTVTSAAR